MQQINLEFGAMNISTPDPIQRIQAIDLTKRSMNHAVILNCPKVMVDQGAPTQENKETAIATLKTMGDYAKSKGVKVSMEERAAAEAAGAPAHLVLPARLRPARPPVRAAWAPPQRHRLRQPLQPFPRRQQGLRPGSC